MSTEHGAVLVIESHTKFVRYYETLEEMKQAILARAKKILGILELDVPLERRNEFRQVD